MIRAVIRFLGFQASLSSDGATGRVRLESPQFSVIHNILDVFHSPGPQFSGCPVIEDSLIPHITTIQGWDSTVS